MASNPRGLDQLFQQLNGPYRTSTEPTKVGGSLKLNIDVEIRERVGLTLDGEQPELDCYYFDDEEKLVVDFEGVPHDE
jgi:hypothetical protein